MNLKVGTKWGGVWGAEVVGVSDVSVGGRSWRCLRVIQATQEWKRPDRVPTVYAEWYVAETGRTVFFRRYNGPGWRVAGKAGSFESLAGGKEVEHQGITYRHWYDCIPDIALGD